VHAFLALHFCSVAIGVGSDWSENPEKKEARAIVYLCPRLNETMKS
jgi:hypothetical protein